MVRGKMGHLARVERKLRLLARSWAQESTVQGLGHLEVDEANRTAHGRYPSLELSIGVFNSALSLKTLGHVGSTYDDRVLHSGGEE